MNEERDSGGNEETLDHFLSGNIFLLYIIECTIVNMELVIDKKGFLFRKNLTIGLLDANGRPI